MQTKQLLVQIQQAIEAKRTINWVLNRGGEVTVLATPTVVDEHSIIVRTEKGGIARIYWPEVVSIDG